MTVTDLTPLAIIALATLVAAATDLWKFKVYNALTFPLFLFGVLASAMMGGWQGLESSLLGSGLGFLFLFFLYALGGVGGGDVKLLTAVGAWVGPYFTYQIFVNSAFCAGIYAIILVLCRSGLTALLVEFDSLRSVVFHPRSWKPPESPMSDEVKRPDRRRRLVPYAVMVCLGYIATIARWHDDLEAIWPPYPRPSAVASVPVLQVNGEVGR